MNTKQRRTEVQVGRRARIDNDILTNCTHDVHAIYECDPETLDYCGLKPGVEVTFESTETTLTIEPTPECRYGFTGQVRDQVVKREVVVTESLTYKLRRKAGALYWNLQGE